MFGGAHIRSARRHPERHHCRGQPADEGSRLAGHDVDGQEPLRAEERATRGRSPQPHAIQLGRRPGRVCRRADAAELERPDAVGRGRGRRVQRQCRGAFRQRLQSAGPRRYGDAAASSPASSSGTTWCTTSTATTWAGTGIFAQIGGEPTGITFDHNTIMHSGNIVTFYSGDYIDPTGARVNGGPVARLRLSQQPDAPQRLRHLRQRAGLRQRIARLLRAWRRRAAQRHGQQHVGGVTLSGRQPVSVARRLQCVVRQCWRTRLPARRRQSVHQCWDRRQEHRLRLPTLLSCRCRLRRPAGPPVSSGNAPSA